MLYKYSDFINEGTESRRSVIYYNLDFDKVSNDEWTEISTTRHIGSKYTINFKAGHGKYAGDGKYDYYCVLIEKKGSEDLFYLEDPTKFIEKFKVEFMKSPTEYVKNLKYSPKCLGDLSHFKIAQNYNL